MEKGKQASLKEPITIVDSSCKRVKISTKDVLVLKSKEDKNYNFTVQNKNHSIVLTEDEFNWI